MGHALQVRFRQLSPDERLVAMAAASYAQMRRVLPDVSECNVSLARVPRGSRSEIQALVSVQAEDAARAEAQASHRDAEVALRAALGAAWAQLGRGARRSALACAAQGPVR